MLKDAALLELDLLLAALDEGLVLKDASPYNVQWRGAKPVFVDVGSFERLREGEPWAGYRQFCTLVLYPLLLQAYKGVPFQPWLRGSLEGIEPAEMRALSASATASAAACSRTSSSTRGSRAATPTASEERPEEGGLPRAS